jgi:hypothetical protein
MTIRHTTHIAKGKKDGIVHERSTVPKVDSIGRKEPPDRMAPGFPAGFANLEGAFLYWSEGDAWEIRSE